MAVESPPRGTSATALYCYGIVPADAAASQPGAGLGQEPVEPVRHGKLVALTSAVPRGRVRARRSDLLTHFDVLGNAFERGTALPSRLAGAAPGSGAFCAPLRARRAADRVPGSAGLLPRRAGSRRGL